MTASRDTVFCESGASIVNLGTSSSVFYLMPGATYSEANGHNTVLYADGVSLDFGNSRFRTTIHCPGFAFDYTDAPPNAAHPHASVAPALLPTLRMSPNPTRGILTINEAPVSDLDVSVLNVLGETMVQLRNPHSSDFTLDLSKLAAGAYYVRFTSGNAVDTRKIVKE
jgi:hypothetical protein